jgi:CDGSH-type Zn-finger protein
MDEPTLKMQPHITVSKNGPYLVSGEVPMAEQIIVTDDEGTSIGWRKGKEYDPKPRCALCRCGHSKNKPYCDGSHLKTDFDGTETASRKPYDEQTRTIEGPALTLTDVQDLCAFARFCDRAEGIWTLVECSDEPDSRDTAIQEGKDCPSGRLVVWNKDGTPIEPTFEPSIGLVEDPQMGVLGPLWVRGGITVVSQDGATYEVRNRVTLCRCGRSGNKPFCDGSHAAR